MAAEEHIHQVLIDKLKDIRYGKQTQASRPRKNEKLPPGTSYTCTGAGDQEAGGSGQEPVPSDSDSNTSQSDSDSDTGSESDGGGGAERSVVVGKIVERWEVGLKQKKKTSAATKKQAQPQAKDQEKGEEDEEDDYPVNCYVVASYEGDWYLGQVIPTVPVLVLVLLPFKFLPKIYRI